jgi:hypothetical protein
LAAVAALTVSESLSWAGDGSRISSPEASFAVSWLSVSAVLVGAAGGLGLRYDSSAPLYSGMSWTSPLFSRP